MKIKDMPEDCLLTNSGLLINVFEPTEDMICIEDIAHGLSNQCRFAGHIKRYYSVAQHSVLCMRMATKDNKLAALLHDGTEAMICDLPSPVKRRMPEYKKMEDKLMIAIAKKFNFEYPFDKEIKIIDMEMLQIEWDNLVETNDKDFICWSPAKAKRIFLKEYHKLQEALELAV
jgi:hypothetical protein